MSATPPLSQLPTPPVSRKRKRGVEHSASPAPFDNTGEAAAPPELLHGRRDLSSRPRLSISRGPTFVPFAEDSQFFKTDAIGFNHLGFRYTPAGINPPGYAQPCRTIESSPTSYRVSWEDRSPFIGVSKDGLRLCGGKGFRGARCNAPMREGKWYLEVKILRGGGESPVGSTLKQGSHVRLGWARREAPLNGPAGLDGYSYGYRDITGEKVTLSRPRPYGIPFKTGDVIGMYISLPPRSQPPPDDADHPGNLKRERIAIDFKGQEVFETLEYTQTKEMIALMDYSGKSSTSTSIPPVSVTKKSGGPKGPPDPSASQPVKPKPELRPLPILRGSCIAFFVNGVSQGVAFQDIYDFIPLRSSAKTRKKERKKLKEGVKEHRENPFDDGTLGYYPFISLFNGASVEVNPGPDFTFSPPPDIDAAIFPTQDDQQETKPFDTRWRPANERYKEFMQEQWDLDQIEEEEARQEAAKREEAMQAEADKKAARVRKKQEAEAKKRVKMEAQAAAQIPQSMDLEPQVPPPDVAMMETDYPQADDATSSLSPSQPSQLAAPDYVHQFQLQSTGPSLFLGDTSASFPPQEVQSQSFVMEPQEQEVQVDDAKEETVSQNSMAM